MEFDFTPYKLLSEEERQQHIDNLVNIIRKFPKQSGEKILDEDFTDLLKQVDFVRDTNELAINLQLQKEIVCIDGIGYIPEERGTYYKDLLAKNNKGYEEKKNELEQIISEVKRLNDWGD
jgi:hypothetical protein